MCDHALSNGVQVEREEWLRYLGSLKLERGAKVAASAVDAAAGASGRPVVGDDALDAVLAGWSLETWRTHSLRLS